MNIPDTLKTVAAFATMTGTRASVAHDGHLMTGTHWHATDVWGFAAMGCVLAVAIWLGRGDK